MSAASNSVLTVTGPYTRKRRIRHIRTTNYMGLRNLAKKRRYARFAKQIFSRASRRVATATIRKSQPSASSATPLLSRRVASSASPFEARGKKLSLDVLARVRNLDIHIHTHTPVRLSTNYTNHICTTYTIISHYS